MSVEKRAGKLNSKELKPLLRRGKVFEFGNPYISSDGLGYMWPKRQSADDTLFKGKRKEAGPYLLERAKYYMRYLHKEFGIKFETGYPYLNIGMEGMQIHLSSGGR